MCGIAGGIDLSGQRPFPPAALCRMAAALLHRGPDEDGFLERPGLGLASRRLSIVGLADGRQPVTNEDRSVFVVFNGEIFEYPELRAELEGHGHRFRTHTDTEVIPHLWEDHQEGMFERLRGQFAIALWDAGRQRLILARDRLGICPLFWTRQKRVDGEWLLFASEIKALLASGMVEARPDVRGIDHLFSFLALPGPLTCFEGVRSLRPGHFLSVQPGAGTQPAVVREQLYWEMDFPDRGEEEDAADPRPLVDGLEERLLRAVERRLRADVPVVSYLSGGLDSSVVLAMASKLRGQPPPAFTIQTPEPGLDETPRAALSARHVGADPVVVRCGAAEILGAYPSLASAAECPVSDTCCAALLLLAREVHARGYKVALTGEGADESLAGYPWYKVHKLFGLLDAVPCVPLGQLARRAFAGLIGAPGFSWEQFRRDRRAVGGPNAWLDLHSLIGLFKRSLYGQRMLDLLGEQSPYESLGLNLDRLRCWHPLHRSLYLGIRTHLPGLLLSHGGDRVAMQSSVETRYPFLDEDVVAFLARLHPRWKLRGFTDKYLLRLLAGRWLPREIAWRPKAMFRAPFDILCAEPAPAFVDQLLSPESLRKTDYFDARAVWHWRQAFAGLRPRSARRAAVELGLGGVVATQLWHHIFVDGSLADLPSLAAPAGTEKERAACHGTNAERSVLLPLSPLP
ncbi:MAG TPA: asparagine synthase (glutamine-hydrolyzing) [Gemmataceae bacterium]|nr:asparagine synthase (glutamine-hydrolyzing) [Gemmataceae bacterium]